MKIHGNWTKRRNWLQSSSCGWTILQGLLADRSPVILHLCASRAPSRETLTQWHSPFSILTTSVNGCEHVQFSHLSWSIDVNRRMSLLCVCSSFCAFLRPNQPKKMYQRWPFFLLHGPAYTWKQHAFVPKCLCTVCRVHLYIEILCGRQALGFACLHAAQSNLSSTGFLAVDTFRFQSHEPVIIRFHCDTLISCRGRCRESCNSM